MLRKCLAVALILGIFVVIGCSTHNHKVGNGAQGNDMMMQRQWYILFGLVPLNEVDTKAMAGGATDYHIMTQQTPLDIVINLFTSAISVYSRTVVVRK